MHYLWAFVVGGTLCVAGQLLIDLTNLTPARVLVLYVTSGVALSAIGLYGPLVELAGAGATVPLTGFGHLLAQGVKRAVDEQGLLGALTGGGAACAAGVAASLITGVIASLLTKSRDQN
ncbi:stage V sporulation protein AE [Gemmiger sp. An120]|uniref:SpoVA/SpoVAEb family sporulation membrane protein n=1 Tax=Gemmiger TaxID=204475 RepID=UPI000B38E525|nr:MULTISPECIES: SpoVA/SpoVAEb family sporulation membrane protein [Gemmiger]MBM6915864.1 SpoVA/SpoVAEb family sporulation membrane protein [Gemmiger formicilis]OUQ39137.1 stage V sporulation protein AE [Gemmiger sp. An120]HIX34253.1 SpoVA/SpoVAEb family sporulation membrane protein [Candidatus Gemmiger avium]